MRWTRASAFALRRAVWLTLCLAAPLDAQTNLVTLASDGAWTWFNDPRALFHNGALYVGFVRSDGAATLNALDLRTGIANTLWTSTWRQNDDHDNPGLLRLQDGRLLAIYARHGTAQTFSYRLSTTANPATPAAWGAEQTLPATGTGLTYANPYQLAAESGKVYDFSRDLNFNPTVFTSTDSGASWSNPQLFIKAGTGSTRPYVKYCSDYSSRIDFLYTDGHPRDVTNSLYHAFYQAGALYKTDGTFLKSFSNLPLLHDSGERGSVIYQYSAANTADPNDHIPTGRAWCWESAYQTNGWPVCVFTVQRDQVTGTDWTDDRIYYYYARWTGAGWQKQFVAQAGRPLYGTEDDYAGGIALDPEDPSVVYISTDAANPFDLTTTTNVALGPHFEIFKGITTNGGLSFSWTPLTTNSTVDHFRPYVPRNRQGVPALLWFRGSYPTFTSYTTSIVGLFTNSFTRAGLTAWWPLDSAAGGTTPELAAGNHLTLYGSPAIGAGVISNAFSFDGASQYLSVAHDPAGTNGLPLYRPGGVFTVAFWVRGAAQTAKCVFAESSTTNNNPLFLLQSGQTAGVNNKFDIYLRTTSGSVLVNHYVSTRPVFDGTWHHAALVDNAGAIQLYVDGNADTNFTYTPSGSLALNATTLGALVRSSVSGHFSGSIDDVLAWQRALSQAEVQGAMSNSIPMPVPEPPVIVAQSPGSTNAMGDYVSFSVQVLGDPPLAYQWLQNGASMLNQTNNVLIAPTGTSGSNSFALRVANASGSVTSAPIPLVVLPDPPANLSGGLVSWWPLDTVSNDSGTVSSPDVYSRDDFILQFMDASNLVAGPFGSALSFDGVRQYGQCVGGFPIYLTTNYTISLWIKGAPGEFNKQVFGEASSGGNFFLLGTENATGGGSLNVKVSPGLPDRKSARVVFDNSWHHVVWVDEGGLARLFVDGALDETDYSYPRSHFPLESTSLAALVRSGPANYFSGAIDEVALWSRPLTLTEIRQVATNGLPHPAAPLPPAIFAQPSDQTNGIYAGDAVAFSVLASGTEPLSYQWKFGQSRLTGQTSRTLSIPGAQIADSGSYSVVITNIAGSVTSRVVQLAVIGYTPVSQGVALQLDVDLSSAPNTQPDFQPFLLADNGALFSNAVQVTISSLGNINLAERLRSTAPMVADNPPALTQARIYNDFIFASSTTDGTGLSILISRLIPNTPYGLTLWSYDPQSSGSRVSDWTETASGVSVPVASNYTFNGSALPVVDYDYTFGARLSSSASGQLRLQGLRHGGTSYGVFVNGLQLVANPAILITSARVVSNGNLEITVETQYSGQPVSFQKSSTLAPAAWQAATDAVIIQSRGPRVIAQFPRPASRLFYRALAP